MQIIERFRPWYGRKVVRGTILAGIIVLALVFFLVGTDDTASDTTENILPAVTLTTPTEFAGGQSLSLVGNVRAFSEAAITAERSGRVTSVAVDLGDTIAAGQVIATLENAAERAAVLQAEGVYEAALASAAQSNVTVSEAETALQSANSSAINTIRAAYTTNNSIIVNNIDAFFSQPNSPLPGLRIGGQGYTQFLNNERVAYQTLLPNWKLETDQLTPADNLSEAIETAVHNTERTLKIVDTFLYIFDEKDDDRYAADEAAFTNLRSTLIGQLSSLNTAQSAIDSAVDAVQRAELTASGGVASAADAQVKQALGSLRAAQASLAKTILRSPISGTVNALSLRTGDFVNQSSQVAEVANNNALEIVTYISDTERDVLAAGDEVTIEGSYTGTVTHIAPAVDAITRKIEVRIAAENIEVQNGDTVRVTKSVSDSIIDAIYVPLSAVKFSVDTGVMFTVENDELVERAVSIGNVRGGSVEITEGLAADELFVVDARGLQAGQAVEITE